MQKSQPNSIKKPFVATLTSLLAGLYASGASAQLEEVIVTAQKRAQSVQDIPSTVNAISGESLDNLQVLNFDEVADLVPGLALDSNDARRSTITLRGAAEDPDNTATGAIVTYWNEIAVPTAVAFKPTYDLERMEVLRGPQGTLQGKTAPAGQINIVTRAPHMSEYDGYVRQTFADNDTSNTQFGASLPIIENELAIRLSGIYEETDGQEIVNINNGDEESRRGSAGRLTVSWLPTDSLDIKLAYDYRENDAVNPDPLDGPGNLGLPEFDKEDREANAVTPYSQKDRQELAALNLSWDLGGHTLTSVTGYQEVLNKNTQDSLKSGIVGVPQIVYGFRRHVDQEFRIANNDADFWEYTAGIFYNETTSENLADVDARPFGRGILSTDIPITSETIAVFTHNTFQVTDVSRVDVGLRYQHNNYRSKVLVSVDGEFQGDRLEDYDNTSEDAWTGTLSYSHDVGDDGMVYLAYDRGYRAPGVVISLSDLPPERLPYDEETSDSLELGYKATMLDGSLQFSAVAYYQQYDGYQARQTGLAWIPDESGSAENIAGGLTYNADSTMQGVEFEWTHLITDNLIWGGGLSYIDSSIDSGETQPCTDLSVVGDLGDCEAGGEAVAPVPDWALTVNADYSLAVGSSLEWYLRGLYRWQSEVTTPTVPDDEIGDYGVMNLYTGLRSVNGAWDVSLWARNLFDEQSLALLQPYESLAFGLDAGLAVARMIPQRVVGVSLQYNWGL